MKEANRQLSDRNFYIPQITDLTNKHATDVSHLLQQLFDAEQITHKVFRGQTSSKNTTARLIFSLKYTKHARGATSLVALSSAKMEALPRK
jgi:hypothetical protein